MVSFVSRLRFYLKNVRMFRTISCPKEMENSTSGSVGKSRWEKASLNFFQFLNYISLARRMENGPSVDRAKEKRESEINLGSISAHLCNFIKEGIAGATPSLLEKGCWDFYLRFRLHLRRRAAARWESAAESHDLKICWKHCKPCSRFSVIYNYRVVESMKCLVLLTLSPKCVIENAVAI